MIVVISKAREIALRVRSRFRRRVLEWEHSTMITLWGAIIMLNPKVFEGPSFTAFVGGPAVWGPITFGAGVVCILALCVNGYLAKPTAVIRLVGVGVRIAIFAAISLGLLFSWGWPPGLAVYPVAGFFGLFAIRWALFDVAYPDGHYDERD